MSLFKMSFVVADKLVRIRRNFLWGWGSEGRKIAWGSWKKICEPREIGGLGVIDLRIFNLALLGKWIWRLGRIRVVCERRFLNLNMEVGEVLERMGKIVGAFFGGKI